MVSRGQIESLTEEAVCPICLDSFTDPVILECGHNFCRSCITQFWEREQRNSCPDLTLKVNRALANLSEKVRKLNLNPKGKKNKLHCEKHKDELKLFCETDGKLLCVICRDAREHREHRFLPIEEVVAVDKDQVKSAVESLTEKKSELEEMERQQKDKIAGVREEAHQKRSISEDDKSLSVTHGSLPVEKFNHPFLLNTTLREMFDASKQGNLPGLSPLSPKPS
ncbi:zinc-binding protein A33-like isoform X2 [Mobula birostris]|uniref:zinc-binding protein A33-like isoform X2 n=1 Tax=Mobula birostris TaxID=1983395 RepID=UPI003B27C140